MILSGKLRRLVTDAYFVGVLMLSTSAFVSVFVPIDSSAGAQGSPIFKFLWLSIYLISSVRLVRQRHKLATLIRSNKALVFMLLAFMATYFWSINRSLTLHGCALLIFPTLFVADFSLKYPPRRQLELVFTALSILVIMGIITDLIFPGFIPAEAAEGGAWHGVFGFKNMLGRVVCLFVVAGLSIPRRSPLVSLLIIVTGLGVEYLSKSVSSVGYTLFLIAVLAGWSILRWRPKPRLAAILTLGILGTCAVYYVSQHFDSVLASMNKDPHLTGRVDLWQGSIFYIEQRPLLGYGVGAFWGPDSQPARRIREAIHWDDAPHPHNAYIALTLDCGLVGLGAYFICLAVIARRALYYFNEGSGSYRRWPLTFLVFGSIYQFTESGIVGGNNLMWIIFASFAFSLPLNQRSMNAEESSPLNVVAA